MKIGIDARTILDPRHGEQAGVGHYTYHLMENLLKIDSENKYVFFFDPKIGDAGYFKRKNTKIKFFPFVKYKKFLPFAYSHFLVAANISEENLDVFHSPASTIPLAYTKKAVVTIHDLAIYVNPRWFPRQVFSTKVAVPKTLKKVEKIIAVSESTKRDIIKFLKVPEEKIKVIYNGVDRSPRVKEEDFREKFGITQKYILFIATLEPRKNVTGLIEAFDKLRPTEIFKEYQLVITGKKGWFYDDIFKLVRELGLTKKVIFTSYVSSGDKVRLFRGAELFVFPSFYEGFGLSLLEAMREGTPVITSRVTSMPEVVEDAGLLINPEKVEAIANAIKKVLTDNNLKNKLIQRGLKQYQKFSWQKCARETLAVYKEVVSAGKK